ncbi:MFS transporter [Yersinia rochesterensis]|uniref:MFS transporter n=1 Tax=Yersinia rochesterensis TaxID=1604335 RepID=A0A8D4N1D4_9GAMM|nr:MFS transporter [Yersinia rochesterensis]AYD42632.1 MFS transporter [Yersinia rochesterensis]
MNSIGFKYFLLYSVSVLTIAGTTIVAPSLPEFNFHNTLLSVEPDFLYRMTLTLPALATALAGLLLASLRVAPDKKKLMITGLLGYAVFGSSGFFTDDAIKLICSRFLLGISVAILMYSVTFFLSEVRTSKDIRKTFYSQSAFMGGANILVSLFSGFLATLDWKYPFLIYLISLLLIPGVIIFLHSKSVKGPIKQPDTTNKMTGVLRGATLPLVFCALAFLNMSLYFTIPSLLPYFIKNLNSDNIPSVGFCLSFVCAMWFFSSLYFRQSRIFTTDFMPVNCGFMSLGLGLFILGSSHSSLMIFIGLFFIGVGLGLNIPNFNIIVISLSDERTRPMLISILITSIYLGQFLAPTFAEPVISQFGLPQTFKVYGIIASMIAIFGFTLSHFNAQKVSS